MSSSEGSGVGTSGASGGSGAGEAVAIARETGRVGEVVPGMAGGAVARIGGALLARAVTRDTYMTAIVPSILTPRTIPIPPTPTPLPTHHTRMHHSFGHNLTPLPTLQHITSYIVYPVPYLTRVESNGSVGEGEGVAEPSVGRGELTPPDVESD